MGKYITESERYKIEVLLKEKYSVAQIAKIIGKTRQTIYNEIKRGKTKQLDSELREQYVYLADRAQEQSKQNQSNKGREYKIGNDMNFVKYVEKMKNEEKYSPYAILESIKKNNLQFNTQICLRTLYNYLEKGLFLNIPTKKKKTNREKRKVALNNLKGTSIEKRPKEIKERKEYGHWEMDTVVSGQGKGKSCLLVLTERASREELIFKMPNKKAESTVKVLNKLEKQLGAKNFRETFKTITVDNGVEFLDFTGIEKSKINKKLKRTNIYYCHPYCSSERGSNENANKLIRKFIPKGTNIDEIEEDFIYYIQNWINNYPRKIHNGLCANEKKRQLLTT